MTESGDEGEVVVHDTAEVGIRNRPDLETLVPDWLITSHVT